MHNRVRKTSEIKGLLEEGLYTEWFEVSIRKRIEWVVIEEARGVPRKYSTHNRISLNLSIEGGAYFPLDFTAQLSLALIARHEVICDRII